MFLAQTIACFQIYNFGIGGPCHDLSEFLTEGSVEQILHSRIHTQMW